MVPDTFCFTSACVLCGEEAVQDCLNAVRFDVRMQAFERHGLLSDRRWFVCVISRIRLLVLSRGAIKLLIANW